MSNKAWIQYTKEGRIIPGSLIISKTRPVNGVWYEVVEKIYNSPTPPFGVISSKTKAFVKYDDSGQIVPGSLIITNSSLPKPGIWKEVYVNIPSSIISTTTSTTSTTSTTTTTTIFTNTTTTTTTICPNCTAPDVTISGQTWAGCNLNVDHYLNGDPIPEVTNPAAWAGLTTGAWCWYNNDSSNGALYGRLYNWYAVVDPRGIAPTGYHVPSDAEWTILTDYLGGETGAGGKLKKVGEGFCTWNSPNTGATNTTGFTALPGGFRHWFDGAFVSSHTYGFFWSSTEYDYSTENAYFRFMSNVHANVIFAHVQKNQGQSVRLIKD